MKSIFIFWFMLQPIVMYAQSVELPEEVNGGFTAKNWSPEKICYMPGSDSWKIFMKLYKDKKAKQSGKLALRLEVLDIPAKDMPSDIPKLKGKVVKMIKAHSKFSGATEIQ